MLAPPESEIRNPNSEISLGPDYLFASPRHAARRVASVDHQWSPVRPPTDNRSRYGRS